MTKPCYSTTYDVVFKDDLTSAKIVEEPWDFPGPMSHSTPRKAFEESLHSLVRAISKKQVEEYAETSDEDCAEIERHAQKILSLIYLRKSIIRKELKDNE